MYVKGYRCTICSREYSYKRDMLTCEHCGEKGILDIVFDYKKIKREFNKEKLAANPMRSIWRYLPLLPVDGKDFEKHLRVGFSPLYRSIRLERELSIKALYIKDDGINPTCSLKDRASAVAVMRACETGYTSIACASTGNAASSLAGTAARMGLRSVIYLPERAPKAKVAQLLSFGAQLNLIEGDYKAAFEAAKRGIIEHGYYNRNAGINPIMIEGKKTVSFEIAEQTLYCPTDWVAVSVGDGCTIGGVYNGFRELFELGLIERVPRMLGVQSTGCCPFVTAAKTDSELQPHEENTIADSISVGIPRNPRKAQRAVKESNGAFIAVTDEEILKSIQILGSREGVYSEPAAAASLAGVLAATAQAIIKQDESVTVISTGNGLKAGR